MWKLLTCSLEKILWCLHDDGMHNKQLLVNFFPLFRRLSGYYLYAALRKMKRVGETRLRRRSACCTQTCSFFFSAFFFLETEEIFWKYENIKRVVKPLIIFFSVCHNNILWCWCSSFSLFFSLLPTCQTVGIIYIEHFY